MSLDEARAQIGARYEARRRGLAEARPEAALPVRFFRQTSHFTTPASSLETIQKAARGMAGAAGVLSKLGISTGAVGRALGVDEGLVAAALATSGGPPLVIVDAEDATALDPGVLERARESAIAALSGPPLAALSFYRPSGIELPACVEDLVAVISAVASRIDGVVWPKASHEDELFFLDDLLSELEGASGLERRTIKVAFLVESGRGVSRIEKLVDAMLPRLCAVIFGIADYAADVGLPSFANDHPSCDWARAAIVNAAGAVGVPAIDSMTFEYPARDPALSKEENEKKILAAMRRCFDDARHGAALGMEGKWVGHPLQLLANELAYRDLVSREAVERDVAAARAYRASVEKGRGAAMIGGQMADRATDRHARRRLRRALAHGLVAPDVARELGLE